MAYVAKGNIFREAVTGNIGKLNKGNSTASGEIEGNKFCPDAKERGWKSLLKGNKEKEKRKTQPTQALHGSILHFIL